MTLPPTLATIRFETSRPWSTGATTEAEGAVLGVTSRRIVLVRPGAPAPPHPVTQAAIARETSVALALFLVSICPSLRGTSLLLPSHPGRTPQPLDPVGVPAHSGRAAIRFQDAAIEQELLTRCR